MSYFNTFICSLYNPSFKYSGSILKRFSFGRIADWDSVEISWNGEPTEMKSARITRADRILDLVRMKSTTSQWMVGRFKMTQAVSQTGYGWDRFKLTTQLADSENAMSQPQKAKGKY